MVENVSNKWRCTVCGYIHTGDDPPEMCPICGAAASAFEPYVEEIKRTISQDKWQCLNCNYVHSGPKPPDVCPICGVKSDRFDSIAPISEEIQTGTNVSNVTVVGSGIAGVSAVEAIRSVTSSTEITLISKEDCLPYYRLNLTRFLGGEVTEDVLPIWQGQWYRDFNINFRKGCEVESIQLKNKELLLSDGDKIKYEKLIIAVGAHPFIPPFSGVSKQGVMTLRTYDDALNMLDLIEPGSSCVCIGGGILGLETAGALVNQGVKVTVLESYEWLMPRQLNRRAGDLLTERVKKIGITLFQNVKTEKILGEDKVTGVQLHDGTTINADSVVITAGIRPNSHLARKAGLRVNNGVVVDDYLTTSQPDIFAAGDVTEHNGELYGTWSASQYQGKIAGLNAAGVPTIFGGIPRSNTLKVLGIDMMSIGQFEPADGSYQVIEDELNGDYYRFVFHDGCMVGCVLLGNAEIGPAIKMAIEKGRDCSGIIKEYKDVLGIIKHFTKK